MPRDIRCSDRTTDDTSLETPTDLLVRPGDELFPMGHHPIARPHGRGAMAGSAPVHAVVHRADGTAWTHLYQLVRRGLVTETRLLAVVAGRDPDGALARWRASVDAAARDQPCGLVRSPR